MKFKHVVGEGRLKQNFVRVIKTKHGQYSTTVPRGIVEALGFERGSIFLCDLKQQDIYLKFLKKSKDSGVRFEQNKVILRKTKNSQYSITIPKAIAQGLNFKKGEVLQALIGESIFFRRVK